MARSRSSHIPQDPPLELDKNEKSELDNFDIAIMLAECDKIVRVREIARQKGLTAASLEDLKSESGELFVEIDRQKTDHCLYHTASTKEKKNEIAYLCCSMYIDDSKTGCGWVKGSPTKFPYDEMGPMCGSKGYRHFCKICGKKIGETQLVVS